MLVEIKLWDNGGYICLCILIQDSQSHWSIIKWFLLLIPGRLYVFSRFKRSMCNGTINKMYVFGLIEYEQ